MYTAEHKRRFLLYSPCFFRSMFTVRFTVGIEKQLFIQEISSIYIDVEADMKQSPIFICFDKCLLLKSISKSISMKENCLSNKSHSDWCWDRSEKAKLFIRIHAFCSYQSQPKERWKRFIETNYKRRCVILIGRIS